MKYSHLEFADLSRDINGVFQKLKCQRHDCLGTTLRVTYNLEAAENFLRNDGKPGSVLVFERVEPLPLTQYHFAIFLGNSPEDEKPIIGHFFTPENVLRPAGCLIRNAKPLARFQLNWKVKFASTIHRSSLDYASHFDQREVSERANNMAVHLYSNHRNTKAHIIGKGTLTSPERQDDDSKAPKQTDKVSPQTETEPREGLETQSDNETEQRRHKKTLSKADIGISKEKDTRKRALSGSDPGDLNKDRPNRKKDEENYPHWSTKAFYVIECRCDQTQALKRYDEKEGKGKYNPFIYSSYKFVTWCKTGSYFAD